MLTKLWRKLRQQDRVEELERDLFFSREECAMEQMYREQAERELETYKGQWKHALETYGEQEFKITNLTIENERLKDELDRERSDCAELDQENERLKQELEELEDR